MNVRVLFIVLLLAFTAYAGECVRLDTFSLNLETVGEGAYRAGSLYLPYGNSVTFRWSECSDGEFNLILPPEQTYLESCNKIVWRVEDATRRYDSEGLIYKKIIDMTDGKKPPTFTWDGKNARGEYLPSEGTYYVRSYCANDSKLHDSYVPVYGYGKIPFVSREDKLLNAMRASSVPIRTGDFYLGSKDYDGDSSKGTDIEGSTVDCWMKWFSCHTERKWLRCKAGDEAVAGENADQCNYKAIYACSNRGNKGILICEESDDVENEGSNVVPENKNPRTIDSDIHGDRMCAVTADKHVKCWGERGGSSTVETPAYAGYMSGKTVENAKEISVTYNAACALLEDGRVMCWGRNNVGQMGNGKTEDKFEAPAYVSGLSDAVKITDVEQGFCAVTSAGRIKCWGEIPNTGGISSYYDEVGKKTVYSNVPLEMKLYSSTAQSYEEAPALTGVTDICGAQNSVYAIKDGKLISWSNYEHGPGLQLKYVKYKSGYDVENIAKLVCSNDRSDRACVLLKNGAVACEIAGLNPQGMDTMKHEDKNPIYSGAMDVWAAGGYTYIKMNDGRVLVSGKHEYETKASEDFTGVVSLTGATHTGGTGWQNTACAVFGDGAVRCYCKSNSWNKNPVCPSRGNTTTMTQNDMTLTRVMNINDPYEGESAAEETPEETGTRGGSDVEYEVQDVVEAIEEEVQAQEGSMDMDSYNDLMDAIKMLRELLGI